MIFFISFFFDRRNGIFVRKASGMNHVLTSVGKIIRNKYGITLLLFLLWLFFFDEYNLLDHFRNKHKLVQLEEQKDFLKEKIASDQRKIQELKTSQKNLEKFAREQFLMKKENEDVYIVIED